MDRIRTVRSDIAPEELGVCQCHEHLFIEKDRSYELNPALFMDDYQKSLAELKTFYGAGGRAVVDAQPVGCGRMAENLIRASKESNVHIIACTGFHKTIFYTEDSFIFEKDTESLARLFTGEVREGLYSSKKAGFERLTGRAGLIKTAVDAEGIHKDAVYEKLFEAASRSALETGAAVICHIEIGADAFPVVRFFADRGIAAGRLLLCHVDRARYDFGYHRELLQEGVFLEYDTINRVKYHSDEQEADLILEMLRAGYEDKLLWGLDTTNKRLRAYGGQMGLDYILSTFAPYLKSRGVTEKQLYKMFVANPQQALVIKL